MKDEILQPIPQETPEEQILEGILQKTVEGVEQDGAIGEAQLLMQKEVADATKETNTLLDMALPHLTKEVQKVEIVPTVAPTDDQTELAKTFYEMLRGRKGEAGYTPQKGTDYFTDEEVREFLAKTTPKKGTDYFTDEEVATFRELVTPVKGVDYRDGIDGVDGKDGRTPVLGVDYFVPTEEELLAKVPTIDAVLAKIPKPKDGKDGKVPDLDPFLKEMEERLQKDLADRTEVLRKISSRDYDLSELKDVLLTNLQNGQALLYNSLTQKWYNGTVSGGGGGTWGSITGTLSDQTDLQNALDAKLASSLTKAQFDTACSDGNFLFVGDITQYTDEMAQDAVGAMVNDTLVYNDATPSLGLNLGKANTFTADQSVPDEAYGSGWNGSMEVPTKNAIYDKIETLGGSFLGCRLYKSSGQASVSTTLTALTFDSESYDTDTMHDTVTNNTRITIKTAGKYAVYGTGTTDGNAIARLGVRLNGTTYLAQVGVGNAGASTQNGCVIVVNYEFAVNDYIELMCAFGSSQTTTSGIAGCQFGAYKIG